MASLKNAVAFDPRTISGLQLWLDAADISTMTFSSGSNLQTWRNKGAQGGIFSQAGTASRLTYTSSNNYPLINFDSDGSSLNAWMTGTLPLTANSSFFQVITPIAYSVGTWSFYWSWQWSSVGNRLPGFRSLNSSRAFEPYITWVGNNNNSIPVVNGRSYLSFVQFTGGGANTSYSINGNAPSSGLISASNVNSSTFLLGGDGNNGATVWGKMYLSEIIMFSNVLTTSQRQQVEGYLAWKWGLIGSLPDSHPFKQPIVPFTYPVQRTTMRTTQVFDPRSISGLQLWLDAANSFSRFSNGQAITQWIDRSSNRLVGTALNSPTYQTNVLNGLPVIRFNGVNQYINFGNVLNLGTNAITLFFVAKFAINPGNQVGMIGKSSYRGNPGRWAMGYDTVAAGPNGIGVYMMIDDTNQSLTAFAHNPVFQYDIYCGQNNRTSANTTYLNGVQKSQQTFSASANNLSNTDPLYIASYPNNTGSGPQSGMFLNGDIAEVLVYFSNLSTIQRQQIEGYLARKWGLSGNLSTSHPNANPLTIAPFPLQTSSISIRQTAKWQPTSITGCALWLDATDRSKVVLSGNNVLEWNDKSPQSNIITRTGTPLFSSRNLGIGAVEFNGTNAYFVNTTLNIDLTKYSVFFVCQQTSYVTNSLGILVLTNGNNTDYASLNTFIYAASMTSANAYAEFGNAAGFYRPTPYSLTPFSIYTDVTDGSSKSFYRNGNLLQSQIFANLTSSIGFLIGARKESGSASITRFFSGFIGEVLIFSKTLSTIERQQVEGYLAWKWGLQTSLPATHPYAKFPPTP